MEGAKAMNERTIAIFNFKQACAYVKNGVQPIRLEEKRNKKKSKSTSRYGFGRIAEDLDEDLF